MNKGLLESMREMALQDTLASAINPLILRGGETRIRELEHANGKLFVDLVED